MHMSDALISPAVGTGMWLATAGLVAYCAKKLREEGDDRKVPLMGVLGAFIFVSQMINFSIPATGSSGHLGGGMILAILLGPYAAFLVMASVLIVQALFFADGGLLALGCNIFNLGFFPAFIAYPLIYRKLSGKINSPARIMSAATIAAIIGLQLGAFGVVLETVFSGISELPFRTFVLLMQPIHLAIGIVEGMVTAAVVTFVWKAHPEILSATQQFSPIGKPDMRKVLVGLSVAAAIAGGALSWFASANPDGLEWAIFRTSGKAEPASADPVHVSSALIQEKTAVLPDYGFKKSGSFEETRPGPELPAKRSWPAVDPGTSLSGLVGGALTLGMVFLIGFLVKRRMPQVQNQQ
jgi:cobalt/nickel transport system permease protein